MIRVGITGQEGFVGKHLCNTLRLFPQEFELVFFERAFFDDAEKMQAFVASCDVIVHLAAMNRHNDPKIIYQTNTHLVKQLVDAIESTNSKPHIIFSSSSQEERDNLYGKSKKEGRELFSNWAQHSGGKFTGMIIPNIFGPFGKPYYNSFIGTFSHQLNHDEEPLIEVDGEVKLLYVADLVKSILEEIRTPSYSHAKVISHTAEYKVSEVLVLLKEFRTLYVENGVLPSLTNAFELNLFNTFRSYINYRNHFPVKFVKHSDNRGNFVELARLHIGGQVSFSTTVPGITRGNHFHTRKIERFAVIKGKALIQLRKTGTEEILDFYLDGNEPAYVDMPVWYTHNIKNIGDDDLYTVFWINEPYDSSDPDTYMETV